MSVAPRVTEEEYRSLLLSTLDVDTASNDPANEYTIPQLEKMAVAYGIALPIVHRSHEFIDPADVPATDSLEPAAPVPTARTVANDAG